MKKTIILMAIFCFAFSSLASAHPAQDVSLAIVDADLEISISHPVRDLNAHYIYKIIIKINDNIFKEESFTSQPDNDFKVIVPLLEVKIGDVISATMYCNKGGDKTVKVTAEKDITVEPLEEIVE